MVKTNRHILRRFLLYILLLCGLMTGQHAVVQAKSLKQSKMLCFERLFDHETIHIPYIDNGDTKLEEEDEIELIFRVKKIPRKRRYYITSNTQSSGYTTRLLQIQYNHIFYIPLRENKTGVYRQQHAFLPAYYSFLSRYTPF
jgi:hypothetical protein